MIPREEYFGIKWELIYKEMVFANRWVVLRFPKEEIILCKWDRILDGYW
jgi:hypothetical protein